MKIIQVLAALFLFLGCTDPKSLFVEGTIFDFKPDEKNAYALKIGNSGSWKQINRIANDGSYEISVSVYNRDLIDSVFLLRNGSPINMYLIERDIYDKLNLRDTQNGIRYSIEGKGPFFINNLLLCGKIETKKQD